MAIETADEERQLLQIFPNEVWKIVLENVKEVKDYHKICDASPQLRVRLLHRAPWILFPEVAKVLLSNDANENLHHRWVPLRQACHTWKKEMDKLLQKTPDYFVQLDNQRLHEMSGIAFVQDSGLDNPFCFTSVVDFLLFEKHFDPTHLVSGANPFVHRKIDLFIDDEDGLPETYYAACTRFLDKYGKHLWFCIIVYEFEDRNTHIDFYNRRLPTLLERMPNLQALKIEPLCDIEDEDVIEEEAALVQFPTLPHLEYISLGRCPCVFVKQLLQRNAQVRYVDAAGSDLMPAFLQFLSNLRAATFAIESEDSLVHIDDTGFTNSRLERLWLRLMNLKSQTGQVFKMLERHFSQSLVQLHLNLKYSRITESEKLMLPHLKIFHMEMNSPKRIDFLLPMKETLEELHLATERKPSYRGNCRFEIPEPGENESSKLQVYQFWKEPQRSNVWSFFPKLRFLEVKWFRREDEIPEKYRSTRKSGKQKWS